MIEPTPLDPTATWLTPAELAARLRVSPRTLEGWRSTGRGPAHARIGTLVRYHIDDIVTFEDNLRAA